jgi:hypothetical protein
MTYPLPDDPVPPPAPPGPRPHVVGVRGVGLGRVLRVIDLTPALLAVTAAGWLLGMAVVGAIWH